MTNPLNIQRFNTRQDSITSVVAALRDRLSPGGDIVSAAGRQRTIDVFGEPLTPKQVVQRICADVRNDGLSAVLKYTKSLDNVELDAQSLRVSADELHSAHATADPKFLATIGRIRGNIFEFQQAILHSDVTLPTTDGVSLCQRYTPLERAGLCVPGGAAAYPSTVLMTAVPAQAAGVQQLAVVAPPTKFGSNNPDLLATCHEIGITEVYRMGGAQAVAALAYGLENVPAVDIIVGPGSM